MLQRLNKDLLVKLIENINDPNTLSDEELRNRIKTYEEILDRRELKERTENSKILLWEMRNVKLFKELIESNKEEIEKLEFDFSNVTYKTTFDSGWLSTLIFYKGKYQSIRSLIDSKVELFTVIGFYKENDEGYAYNIWRDLIFYVYDNELDFDDRLDKEDVTNLKKVHNCYELLHWVRM